jgi:glycosyltransferase involved in cell wall biosynthesis
VRSLRRPCVPSKWVIVNDGSTDGTATIIDRYAAIADWIERLDMPTHRDRNFAAKAYCFNAAWHAVNGLRYHVIGNLDADITFEPDYLEFLLTKFEAIRDLGVAGTPFLQHGGYDSSRDSFEGENHVAGGCQLFRRRCFEELGGYVPAKRGGVDWIAVTTARMKGWKTRSFREETAVRLGRPRIRCRFSLSAIRRVERPVSSDLMRFHRREQMRKLRAIVETLALLKKLDHFTLRTRPRNSAHSIIVAMMAVAPLARIEALVNQVSQWLPK